MLFGYLLGIKRQCQAQDAIGQLGHNGFGVHRLGQPKAAGESAVAGFGCPRR